MAIKTARMSTPKLSSKAVNNFFRQTDENCVEHNCSSIVADSEIASGQSTISESATMEEQLCSTQFSSVCLKKLLTAFDESLGVDIRAVLMAIFPGEPTPGKLVSVSYL